MMSKFYKYILLFFILNACSKANQVTGEWKLSSWDIGIEVDLNNDGDKSFNLIDEVNCDNNEILTISNNGTLNAIKTFSPIVRIAKKQNSDYVFNVDCNKGSLGFATSYELKNNKILLDSNTEYYIFNEKQLTRVFKDAINIYNSDFSQVIETKDLTLTYMK